MSKKENNYVLSKDEDLKLFEDSLSEDEETVEVNGFEVLVSQILRFDLLGSHLSGSQEKQLKNAFIDVLLNLIETLCQSTTELSLEDLNKEESTLFDLTRAGLEVGWLRQKWDVAYLKKEKQRVTGARIRELEEQVRKRKLSLSDLESDLKNEKAAALVAKSRTGFRDIV
ncbi:MATH domain and coiled-coil domain-containing protein At3g58280 [Arabidopsis lyrata subsp. lyrata]|uniref:MATH domain and coiled-coil domain-containing protein At3g58280 n=1 Tax=Arabidopsis lyrata subsp. lyrata TaxID=81972 RepID=UPI000A29B48F|nr:MATH domain and coiled-coil domain-containing protein At3g58280 [Arabidopsis lyrata subsp. lyrata]|eukprot:XP_020881908.1 MATH domain and coiled-coil domain-containing protein At3g58280 [Arabidopsis lyrata subsp. lyrata]